MIPISHRNGALSEKAGSGCPGDEFLGLGKSGWKPLAVSRRTYLPGSAQLKANGFILTSWKGQKTNSGGNHNRYLSPAKDVHERLDKVQIAGLEDLCSATAGWHCRPLAFTSCFYSSSSSIPNFLLEETIFLLQTGSAEVTDGLFKLTGVPVYLGLRSRNSI